MSISAAPDAGAFVTGIFQGSVNFGTGILTSAGYDDAFVMKLDLNGPMTDEQFALVRLSGAQFINLDQKNGSAAALMGTQQDKAKPQE